MSDLLEKAFGISSRRVEQLHTDDFRNLGDNFAQTALTDTPFLTRMEFAHLRRAADPGGTIDISEFEAALTDKDYFENPYTRRELVLESVPTVCAFPITDVKASAVIEGFAKGVRVHFSPRDTFPPLLRTLVEYAGLPITKRGAEFYSEVAKVAFRGSLGGRLEERKALNRLAIQT